MAFEPAQAAISLLAQFNLHPRIQRPISSLPGSDMQTRSTTVLPSTEECQMAPPPAKRQRSEAPCAASPVPSMSSCRRTRDEFFDALIAGNKNEIKSGITRTIASADDLEKPELLRCFELLHACGRATQPDATLATTRKSIEGFLDAIFNSWKADGEVDEVMEPPALDIHVEAETIAGKVCGKFGRAAACACREAQDSPGQKHEHTDVSACLASESCKTDITAVATYATNSPRLQIELCKQDTTDAERAAVCPLSCSDINWVHSSELGKQLRAALEKKIVAKVHKYNKHVAVWQARKLVLAWAKGEDCKTGCDGQWGFIDGFHATLALMGLGHEN